MRCLKGTPGTLLNLGCPSSFTQADIDNSMIKYQENGSASSADNFFFTVTDPAGNPANGSFQINISASNNGPIASGFNVALTPGSFVNLSSLFTWSDANVADSVVAFAVKDLTSGGGHLWLAVEGSPLLLEPDNHLFDSVSISQLGALPPFWFYQVGPAGAVDQIRGPAKITATIFSDAGGRCSSIQDG